MDNAEIENFIRAIKTMRETVSEFVSEFADLSDPELRTLIGGQEEIAEDANWKVGAAKTELKIRKLMAHLAAGS